MSTAAANQVQDQQTKQLTELISFCYIALKNIRIYPAGHHLVKTRTKAAHQLLTRLLGQRKVLLFGIARDTITFEEYSLGEGSVACSSFAKILSRHEIATLTFHQGGNQQSLFLFLKAVGVLPEDRTSEKTLEQELSSLNISNIEITTVDYNNFDRVLNTAEDEKNSLPRGNEQPATSTWINFTTKLTAGTLGRSNSPEGDTTHSKMGGPEALAAAINAHAGDQAEIIQQFSLHLDHMLHQSTQENPSLPSFDSIELNSVLTALNPKLRDQFLRTTLEKCDQNQEQSNPKKILSTFSNSLIVNMLQLVNKKDVTISPALLNLIQKLSRIEFTPDGATPSAMSRREISNLLEPEKYDQYVGENYHHTLHQLSSALPSDHAPPPEFPLEQHLATLAEDHLNRQIVRATLIFMDGTEGETDYTEFAHKLMEFTLQLPEEGAFGLLLIIAKTLTRHAAQKKSPAIRKMAAECLEELSDDEFLDYVHSALREASEQEKRAAISFLIYFCPDILDTLIKIFCMQQNVSEDDPLLMVFKTFRVETLVAVFTVLPKENSARIKKLLLLVQYLGAGGTGPLLHPLLTHEDGDIQLQALELLLLLHDKKGLATLESMLGSKNEMQVEAAIELCNSHRPVECVPSLLQLFDHHFFKESTIARNRKLFLVLGRIGDKKALPVLEKIAFSKWPLHRQLVTTMKRILFYSLKGYQPEDRINLVHKGLQSEDEEIRKLCSSLLPPQQRNRTGI